MTELAGSLAAGTTTGRWVLDPAGSRADFYVKHFWGAITVHGWFERLSGAGSVTADGAVTGTLTIDTTSVSTKNKQRDNHLRSADFFDAERHPQMVLTVAAAQPSGAATLTCTGTLEAAGQVKPVEFTTQTELDADAAVLRAEITIDRTGFGMTWRPLGIASPMARATVVARFVREQTAEPSAEQTAEQA